MMTYEVYFEIYGKKMKATIYANSEEQAKQTVRNKIIFHKVVAKPDSDEGVADLFGQLLGMWK